MSDSTDTPQTSPMKVVFDREFKIASFVRLLLDPHLIPKYRPCLYPEVFHTKEEHEPLARLAKLAIDKSNRKEPVSFEALYGWLQLSSDGAEKDAALRMYKEIRDNDKIWRLGRSDDFFRSFLDYLKMNRIYVGSQETVSLFRAGRLEEAFKSQSAVERDTQQLNLDHVEITSWEDTLEELKADSSKRKSSGLRIGIPEFDETGGFAVQTMNVFAANTGGGKGMMTVGLAYACVLQKKAVYIAVVEDPKKMFQRRILSLMTKIPYARMLTEVHNFTQEECERVREASKSLAQWVDVEYPFGCNHKTIMERFKLKQAERKRCGLPPYEVFILDYLGHAVKSTPSENNKDYTQLVSAMRDLRDFGLTENLIAFTHWQLNSSGKKKEESGEGLISKYDIGGATDMVNLVDNAIGINRSFENQKKSIVLLNFFKGREQALNGAVFQARTRFDIASYDFSEILRLDVRPTPQALPQQKRKPA
jgi:hypothetical protein